LITLPGNKRIETSTTSTERLSTRLLVSGPEAGFPVFFLHGNFSSASWWEDTLAALPQGYRGFAVDQRGFGNADPAVLVDATLGLEDMALDVIRIFDELKIEQAIVVGNSLGGNVVWRLLMNHSERIRAAVLVAPGSPFGFGGTKDVKGTPCHPDFSGSGAGLVNSQMLGGILKKDRTTADPFGPRLALRNVVFGQTLSADLEDRLLDSMLSTHIGPKQIPGDTCTSEHWPFYGPGKFGAVNALSPRYAAPLDLLLAARAKPPVFWLRGNRDMTVSDEAISDPGRLGKIGYIPDWPGNGIFPPQPMIGQTRYVLNRYAFSGGRFHEVVIDGAGHVPFITHPQKFNRFLAETLVVSSARTSITLQQQR
jgi:pimeloyl-ACP methyl ester carboxylesterase